VTELQWIVSAFTIAFASLILTAGALCHGSAQKGIHGRVEKNRSGIAAGVLNAMRQTGSVIGVVLFGSLVGTAGAFVPGMHKSLAISVALLLVVVITILIGIGDVKK